MRQSHRSLRRVGGAAIANRELGAGLAGSRAGPPPVHSRKHDHSDHHDHAEHRHGYRPRKGRNEFPIEKVSKQLTELKEKHNAIEEDSIISLKINKENIGDYEIFKDILIKKSKENYYSKYDEISKSDKEEYCSVCNEKRDEVYGFVGTFPTFIMSTIG